MAPTMSLEFAVHETILKAVHDCNFRGGVFKSKITRSTSVVQAFNILIGSADITPAEKRVFKDVRKVFITLSKLGREPTFLDVLPAVGCTEKMGEIFEKDAQSQGIYVPGMTMQALNDDGTVKETTVLNSDGSSTTTAGGIHGVPTGAPAHFVKQQEAQTKLFSEAAKKDDFRVMLGNTSLAQKNLDVDGKVPGGVAAPKKDDAKEADKRPSDSAITPVSAKKQKREDDEMDDFTKSFKGLKGAFI
ncbi:hypothetical protein LARI1_G005489 [Lachnellula arida]|uniref:Uncharacterized protein n=1 Tax=Lachnellula arida TaxID=1316785 RepID=A0A8T9BC07_9HELO|nr:hypothetical protein LARI1_G005489 [Lachnellula arida]